jgi:hypothetical protein
LRGHRGGQRLSQGLWDSPGEAWAAWAVRPLSWFVRVVSLVFGVGEDDRPIENLSEGRIENRASHTLAIKLQLAEEGLFRPRLSSRRRGVEPFAALEECQAVSRRSSSRQVLTLTIASRRSALCCSASEGRFVAS